MSDQFSWYLARAGGLVAWTALTLSVLLGLLLAGRLLPSSLAAWNREVHKFLGGLATIFTGVHVAALVADNFVHFGWAEIFVPMTSEWRPGAVAWGIVAMYLLLAVELTSLAMRKLPRRLWRAVHQTSIPLFAAGTLHGFMAGTDASGATYMSVTLIGCAAVSVLAVARRVWRPQRAVFRDHPDAGSVFLIRR